MSPDEQAEYKVNRGLLTKWRDNARHAATVVNREKFMNQIKDMVALMWEMVKPQWIETENRSPRKRYKVSPLLPEPAAEARLKHARLVSRFPCLSLSGSHQEDPLRLDSVPLMDVAGQSGLPVVRA